MTNSTRILSSLLVGLLVSVAFWAASAVSSVGSSAMVLANFPAVAASFIFSSNPHQPSAVAAFVTMVAQWSLLTWVAFWLVGRAKRKGRGNGISNDV